MKLPEDELFNLVEKQGAAMGGGGDGVAGVGQFSFSEKIINQIAYKESNVQFA